MEIFAGFLKIEKRDGHGYGSGSGHGYNPEYSCDFSGDGDGDGSGAGVCNFFDIDCSIENSEGRGDGSGKGDGLKSINNHRIYNIDGVRTIIYSIRNNIAKGAVLKNDLTLLDCYIVKQENEFAHGATLRDAQLALLEKLLISKPIEQRIEEFKSSFPEIDKKYNAEDLYDWHYLLTGSCKMGRDSFVKDNSIDLSKKYSVREFIDYTIDSYKGEIIRQLEKMY